MDARNAWFEPLLAAIPLRHSVRAYVPDPLPEELPRQMETFFATMETPFAHQTKLHVFQAVPGKKLYNNGINPVDNLALSSPTDLASISKTGFLGELVMLYAVSLGLDTCWFGHYKLAEAGKYIPGIATPERRKESTLGYGYGRQMDVGERVVCCMPFGHRDPQIKRLVDRVAGRNGAGRKPLQTLLEKPEVLERIPPALREALELARWAPSAANSQMWRFGFAEDFRQITIAKPVGYKHFKWEHPDVDVGMCAAHLWLGLLAKGMNPQVEVRIDRDRALWSMRLSGEHI